MSLILRETLILAINLAGNEVDLAHWWGQHKAVLKSLSDEDWQAVWVAKETRRQYYRRAFEERMKADGATGDARPSAWGKAEDERRVYASAGPHQRHGMVFVGLGHAPTRARQKSPAAGQRGFGLAYPGEDPSALGVAGDDPGVGQVTQGLLSALDRDDEVAGGVHGSSSSAKASWTAATQAASCGEWIALTS